MLPSEVLAILDKLPSYEEVMRTEITPPPSYNDAVKSMSAHPKQYSESLPKATAAEMGGGSSSVQLSIETIPGHTEDPPADIRL